MAQLQNTSVSGSLFLSGSVTGPTSLPHRHGAFYVKSDGKPYFSSSQVSETDLSSGGSADLGTVAGTVSASYNNYVAIYTGSAGQYDHTTGLTGSHSLVFDAHAGKLGIGTKDPLYSLHATGPAYFGDSAGGTYWSSADDLIVEKNGSHAGITIHAGASSNGNIAFADGTSSDSERYNGLIQYSHSGQYFRIYAGGQLTEPDLWLDTNYLSASVGIEATNLKIHGTSSFEEQLQVSGSDGDTIFGVHSTSKPNIIRTVGAGRVGINSTTDDIMSSHALTVNNPVNSNVAKFTRAGAGNYLELRNQLGDNGAILNAINADLAFWHDTAETARLFPTGRMRFSSSQRQSSVEITGSETGYLFGVNTDISSSILFVTGSGRVGLNTSNPSYPLTVKATKNAEDMLGIMGNDGTVAVRFDVTNTNNGLISVYRGGTANHKIDGNGDVIFNEAGLGRDFRVESDNSTHMFYVDGDNDRIGIGTSSPSGRLEISASSNHGAIFADSYIQLISNIIEFKAPNAASHITMSFDVTDPGGNDGIFHWNGATDNFKFDDDVLINEGEKIYFHDLGGEYIAGTGAALELHASSYIDVRATYLRLGTGGGGVDPYINFNGNANDGRLYWMTDEDHFKFSDDVLIDGAEKLYFNDIGGEYIESDGDELTIAAGDGVKIVADYLEIGKGTVEDPKIDFKGINNDGMIQYDESAAKFLFKKSAIANAAIVADLENLYVGIGENVTSPAYFLDVSGSGGASSPDENVYIARFFNDGGHYNSAGIIIQCSEDDGAPAKQTIFLRANDGNGDITGHLSINTSGVFSLTDSSDEKLKDNIRPTKYVGLDVIRGINICDFEWKKSGKTRAGGFIAQNVEKFFPEAVSDTVEDGGEITKGVSYGVLVAPAIKAIQEQQEIIEKLLARVEELENKIN